MLAVQCRPCALRTQLRVDDLLPVEEAAKGEDAAMYPKPSPRGRTNAGGTPMNILLFSMPDSFEHMPPIAIRMPNGALTSLAGNVDPHHRVAAADLLLVQNRVRETVERLVAEHQPDIVGLSVMTFQRKTAKGIIDLVRTRRPHARVVVGGYIRASLPRPTPRTLTAVSTSSCGARARSRSMSCCARSRHSADTTRLRACPTEAPTDSATTPRGG